MIYRRFSTLTCDLPLKLWSTIILMVIQKLYWPFFFSVRGSVPSTSMASTAQSRATVSTEPPVRTSLAAVSARTVGWGRTVLSPLVRTTSSEKTAPRCAPVNQPLLRGETFAWEREREVCVFSWTGMWWSMVSSVIFID